MTLVAIICYTMAAFFTNLMESIFTPGPTPTLIVATNASFAALQVIFLVLLIATYSVHFLILSFLSGGLWWAINWFATELHIANQKEAEAKRQKEAQRSRQQKDTEDSGTETEGKAGLSASQESESEKEMNTLAPEAMDDGMRKRRSVGETSGYQSTDSEWDKVEEAGEMER